MRTSTTRALRQLAHSPRACGLAAATALTGAVLALEASFPASLLIGAIGGGAWSFALSRLGAIERRLRCAEDVGALALRRPVPMLGEWTPEPDFLRIVEATVLERAPALTVELGSGISSAVIAGALDALGDGRLVSVDHDAAFLERTRRRLERDGTAGLASMVHAPLEPVAGKGSDARWYRVDEIEPALMSAIDLLIVDGPPELDGPRGRALPALHERLNADAVVLFDDGRGRGLTRFLRDWARDHDGYELSWYDTVRGTWALTRGAASGKPGPVKRLFRQAIPHPTGAGRGPYSY